MKNKIKAKPFTDDALIAKLRKDPKGLETFKNYLIAEYKKDNDLASFLSCLRIVVMAQRGAASAIAAKSGMQRTGIYKALTNNVRPRVDTLQNILHGVGLNLSITKRQHRKTA
jgi:DNA-binding phage protein